jgi:hypothetical protein
MFVSNGKCNNQNGNNKKLKKDNLSKIKASLTNTERKLIYMVK